jgi:hypothetical protein
MIARSAAEESGLAAALAPLGEYIVAVGKHKPLADYTRDEVLALVEIVVIAVDKHHRGTPSLSAT